MQKEISSEIKNQFTRILNAWLPEKIAYASLPSISVTATLNDTCLYMRSFGFADNERRVRATPDTHYHIASISKLCTALAIMQLVERGDIKLHDSAVKYLKATPYQIDPRITIKHLLSHTSGLWRDGLSTHWSDGHFPTDIWSVLSTDSQISEPGTQFRYSNVGYALLGIIIEHVSGLSFKNYMEKSVFSPMLMHNTHSDYTKKITHIAKGYGRIFPHTRRTVFPHYATYSFSPATGMVSTSADLGKLGMAFATEHPTIVSSTTRRKMSRIVKKTDADEGYGLGTEMIHIGENELITHAGGFIGHSSFLLIDPTHHISINLLTNTHSAPLESMARGIYQLLIYMISLNATQRKQSHLTQYEGMYKSIMTDLLILQCGKGLISFPPDTNDILSASSFLQRRSKTTFEVRTNRPYGSQGEKAIFTIDTKGAVTTVQQGSLLLRRKIGIN